MGLEVRHTDSLMEVACAQHKSFRAFPAAGMESYLDEKRMSIATWTTKGFAAAVGMESAAVTPMVRLDTCYGRLAQDTEQITLGDDLATALRRLQRSCQAKSGTFQKEARMTTATVAKAHGSNAKNRGLCFDLFLAETTSPQHCANYKHFANHTRAYFKGSVNDSNNTCKGN